MADFDLNLDVRELENIIEVAIDTDPNDPNNIIEVSIENDPDDISNVLVLDFGDSDVGGLAANVLDAAGEVKDSVEEIREIVSAFYDDALDYERLINKPHINSVGLVGNKTGGDLRLINSDDCLLEYEIDRIIFGGLDDGQ